MTDNKKTIAIIVVTYNRITLLKECVDSIRNQSNTEGQIIVINNGSTDGTLEWLNEQSDILTITQKNVGGAGGFYTGMKYAAENGYKYCWLMDDDVICNNDALDKLYEAYHRKEEIGFVCSNIKGVNGTQMNTPAIDKRTDDVTGYSTFSDMLEYGMLKVSIATFVSLFLSCDTIYKVGLPYKEYFIWCDDTEYTERISKQLECYLVGTSIVVHKRTLQSTLDFWKETEPNRIKMYFYYYRNSWFNSHKQECFKDRARFGYEKIKEGLDIIKKGDVLRGKVYVKAAAAFISFYPTIKYPNKNI